MMRNILAAARADHTIEVVMCGVRTGSTKIFEERVEELFRTMQSGSHSARRAADTAQNSMTVVLANATQSEVAVNSALMRMQPFVVAAKARAATARERRSMAAPGSTGSSDDSEYTYADQGDAEAEFTVAIAKVLADATYGPNNPVATSEPAGGRASDDERNGATAGKWHKQVPHGLLSTVRAKTARAHERIAELVHKLVLLEARAAEPDHGSEATGSQPIVVGTAAEVGAELAELLDFSKHGDAAKAKAWSLGGTVSRSWGKASSPAAAPKSGSLSKSVEQHPLRCGPRLASIAAAAAASQLAWPAHANPHAHSPATPAGLAPGFRAPSASASAAARPFLYFDPAWEFNAPKWFDFSKMLDDRAAGVLDADDGSDDLPIPLSPAAARAAASPASSVGTPAHLAAAAAAASYSSTPATVLRSPAARTPGTAGATPSRQFTFKSDATTAFAGTPSITKYYATNPESPAAAFYEVGTDYGAEQLADCLMIDSDQLDDESDDDEHAAESAATELISLAAVAEDDDGDASYVDIVPDAYTAEAATPGSVPATPSRGADINRRTSALSASRTPGSARSRGSQRRTPSTRGRMSLRRLSSVSASYANTPSATPRASAKFGTAERDADAMDQDSPVAAAPVVNDDAEWEDEGLMELLAPEPAHHQLGNNTFLDPAATPRPPSSRNSTTSVASKPDSPMDVDLVADEEPTPMPPRFTSMAPSSPAVFAAPAPVLAPSSPATFAAPAPVPAGSATPAPAAPAAEPVSTTPITAPPMTPRAVASTPVGTPAAAWVPSSVTASASKPRRAAAPIPRPAPLTVPHEFSFMRRQRATASSSSASHTPASSSPAAGGAAPSATKGASPARIRASPARKKQPKATAVRRGTTRVRPFRFAERTPALPSSSAASSTATSPYVPLAERVQNFLRTPDRFRASTSRRSGSGSSSTTSSARLQKRLTTAVSPNLRTKHLRRAPGQRTADERERAELDRMKREQFRAQPFNRRIFESKRPLGVPKVPRPRATVAMSPAITKVAPRLRGPSVPLPASLAPVAAAARARPSNHPIVPEPFQLPGDSITEEKKRRFAERVQREEEEMRRMREFHAMPMPDLHDGGASTKSSAVQQKPLTQVKPFKLRTDVRATIPHMSDAYPNGAADVAPKVPEFHARPVPAAVYDPFQPKPSDKPPTEPVYAPVLQTEERAVERQAYDAELAARRAAEEAAAAEREAEQEAVLRRRLRALRSTLVHRARPVPASVNGPPSFVPVHATRPPTVPESPVIGEKRKRIQREMEEERARREAEAVDGEVLEEAERMDEDSGDDEDRAAKRART
ncbi:hypothetical protein H9P43_008503 [Blastocladiella emersonii ATCC 22665]|nr:hypothetical protein H9P43_008503 [Blastocladiella emersonii ATCC 22665]